MSKQRVIHLVWTSLSSPVGTSIGNAIAVSLIGGRSPPEPLVTTK